MKIIVLWPFILLVRVIAHFDPHLFRYWAAHSMDHWRFWGTTWKGYAIGSPGGRSAGWPVLPRRMAMVRIKEREQLPRLIINGQGQGGEFRTPKADGSESGGSLQQEEAEGELRHGQGGRF